MKTFFTVSICLLFAVVLEGQTYFAPIGARWQYFRYQFGPWPPYPPVAEVVATDTLIIQGKPCLKIKGGEDCGWLPIAYLHYDSGRVSYTLKPNEPFVPLYDFNAGVGDTFRLCAFNLPHQCSRFHITAVDSILVSGQYLRVQHVVRDSGYVYWGDRIIQHIGSNGYLFPQSASCDPVLGGLLCFHNGQWGYPTPTACTVGLPWASAPYTGVQIWPNPTDGPFTLSLFSPENTQVLLRTFDPTGRMLHQRILQLHEGENHIEITHLQGRQGLFWLMLDGHLMGKVMVR